jgi:hypothetical protein
MKLRRSPASKLRLAAPMGPQVWFAAAKCGCLVVGDLKNGCYGYQRAITSALMQKAAWKTERSSGFKKHPSRS